MLFEVSTLFYCIQMEMYRRKMVKTSNENLVNLTTDNVQAVVYNLNISTSQIKIKDKFMTQAAKKY